MAPPNTQKRVKGISIFRPFIYGTTSHKFSDKYPKPAGVPDDHTHSWTVFVKGVDDSDITYWCRKVQFKLHDSYPQPLRICCTHSFYCGPFSSHIPTSTSRIRYSMARHQNQKAANRVLTPPAIENVKPGDSFQLHETGWGEFEISIKIYYEPLSLEKAQAIYHTLKLHPFGDASAQASQIANNEVISWVYDEMVFNEPYEQFYEILTSPAPRVKGGGGGKKVLSGGLVGSVGERTALVPLTSRPGQPFSRETEKGEVRRLGVGRRKVEEMTEGLRKELREKEAELKRLRRELEAEG
ncbi:yeats family protein [Rutstroemia sp. NJR-2017a BBW]|nr:yeats family protein [Rutstroemia sp. NJR-2017a BBW]